MKCENCGKVEEFLYCPCDRIMSADEELRRIERDYDVQGDLVRLRKEVKAS